ncbi:X-Pro dipeptidyl-peptidase [Rhodococcus sp. 1163]|uniref:CocE/NonD family hydrolase n=1 Tax=unclassified Rhodococcus (in: high G+C Gram-positive bacteria) TaxID=192944 RepID=UPI000A0139CB|nr:CocE/NonD family hydrolase [Rhodococcus sp. 1163]ORI17824.1 X-Pro dipeptidyl-peptidase [Rhodococcus sp. 1163]
MTAAQLRPLLRPGRAPGSGSERDPSGGTAAQRWRALIDEHPLHPKIAISKNVRIPMSDGAVLRAYVFRPADASGRAVQAEFPTVLNITPYNKLLIKGIDSVLDTPVLGPLIRKFSASFDLKGTPFDGITEITRVVAGGAADLMSVNRHLVRSGYVQIIVDVRGTGSSTGTWDVLGTREQLDSLEIIEWARAQGWCNGRIGMAGISYSAINALQSASKRPAGLEAVFAVEGSVDIVREIFATGGAPSLFIPLWLTAVNALKWAPSLGDLEFSEWLRDRLRSPATDLLDLARGFVTGGDPRIYDVDYYDTINATIEEITAPTFLYGCWHDIFGGSAPDIYNRLALPRGDKQLLVGDGYHGNPGIGFGEPGFPPRLDVLERAWFDKWLRDEDNGIENYGPVTLRQQGGQWTAHGRFPAPQAQPTRLYLSAATSGTAPHAVDDGSLGSSPDGTCGEFTVRPSLWSIISRDTTQVLAGIPAVLGGGFTYDNRTAERGALTFTTPVAHSDTVLSGPINLHLRVVCHAPEALWAIMLCDVDPHGRSTVLTNGALLTTRRAVDDEMSLYAPNGDYTRPHHPLTAATLLPVPIGRPLTLDIDLLTTEAMIAAGHRLRVDVFPTDAPRFMPILPDLLRTRGRRQDLILDPEHPSFLVVPLLGEPGW